MQFMPINNRFFIRKENFTLKEALEVTGIKTEFNTDIKLKNVDTLLDANVGDISFFHNIKYLKDFQNTKASFVFCTEKNKVKISPISIALVHEIPYFAYSQVASLMYSLKKEYPEQKAQIDTKNIATTSVIKDNVIIGENSIIEDYVVLKNGVIIGKNVIIGAGTIIGEGVEIGDNTIIDYNVVIEFAKIGQSCHIYSGVKIGQRGYGFAVDMINMKVIDVPQYGGVLIGDGVDIGANTTVDRGAINDTTIGSYTKIDNLVQIAHNVKLGIGCSVISQAGIAGGAEIGNFVTLGGQSGISGHIKIGDKATIIAQSAVHSGVPSGETYCGTPAVEYKRWKRIFAKTYIAKKP